MLVEPTSFVAKGAAQRRFGHPGENHLMANKD